MTVDINLILQVSLVALVLALTVAAIIFIIVLIDIRQVTSRVKKEIKAVTFLIDIMDFMISGFHTAKKKLSNSKLGKSIKKSIQIIKGGENDE